VSAFAFQEIGGVMDRNLKQNESHGSLCVYIGLGSNLGDSRAALALAMDGICRLPGLRLRGQSSLYRTEPQDLRRQPFFLNQVAAFSCPLTLVPEALLDSLQALENELGRVRRGVRFGPRRLDLDLLLFGNRVMKSERLTVPHPRMMQRAFVLVPLAEIAPDITLPGGLTPQSALEALPYRIDGGTIYQGGALARDGALSGP
jgi:2-amino-4-hydroxy-6-hydroxymethyldihydropteridine diphosphokinase